MFSLFAALLVAGTALAQTGQTYGIKSGTITTETDMMGTKIKATTTFDEYGALSYSRTKTEMMGMTIDMATLTKDGKTYMINYGDKTVQEMPAQESINYMDLNEKTIAKYKVKELGQEVVGGKECTQYSVEINQMGQTAKAKTSVWKGIPMKTVTETMGMSVTALVVDLQEGPVDASLFEVPKF